MLSRFAALVVGIAAALAPVSAAANSAGPLNARTGAPGELTCNASVCHGSSPLNSGSGMVAIDAPESYEAGETYTIFVDIAHPNQLRWGFELTVLDLLNMKAGQLATLELDVNTQISNSASGRQYVKHTSIGTANGQPAGNTWTFEWTAPDPEVGDVTFYAAGNAANGNGNALGDLIYTTAILVPEPALTSMAFAALASLAALHAIRWPERDTRDP